MYSKSKQRLAWFGVFAIVIIAVLSTGVALVLVQRDEIPDALGASVTGLICMIGCAKIAFR